MEGIHQYTSRGRKLWRVRARVKYADGSRIYKVSGIPTQEQAKALLTQERAAAFNGKHFQRRDSVNFRVSDCWTLYAKVDERDNDSFTADSSRSKHLLRLLGKKLCSALSQTDVDAYRDARFAETSPKTKRTPSPTSLDREVELLKRMLGYAVKCGKLVANPLAGVGLLNVPNAREVVVDDEAFERLMAAAADWLKPILLVAYDTGMRKTEVLRLRRDQVDWKAGLIRLQAQDTKTEKPRTIALQTRTLASLKALHHDLSIPWLFVSPRTGAAFTDFRKAWADAKKAAGLSGVWVHDLRRSFATLARKRGVPESVVMQSTGHKTPAVFRRYNIVDEVDARSLADAMERGRNGVTKS